MLYIVIGLASGFIAGHFLLPVPVEGLMPWYVVLCLFIAHLIILFWLSGEMDGVKILRSAGAGLILTVVFFLLELFSGVTMYPAVMIYFVFTLFQDCRNGFRFAVPYSLGSETEDSGS